MEQMMITDTTTNSTVDANLLALQEAAILNNRGVSLLLANQEAAPEAEQRQHGAMALTAFRQSLAVIQELSQVILAEEQRADATSPGSRSSAPFSLMTCLGRVPNLADDCFHICDQPKVFQPPSTMASDEAITSTHLALYSAAVIFNTALTHHRQAVISFQRRGLRSAQRLYETCSTLCSSLDETFPEVSGSIDNDVWMMSMACVNNAAQIRKEVLDMDGLDQYVEVLQGFVARVSSCEEHQEIIKEVQLNVLMAQRRPSGASAA